MLKNKIINNTNALRHKEQKELNMFLENKNMDLMIFVGKVLNIMQ